MSGCSLRWFSMLAGEMFSPPEVMMSSFLRSTMRDEAVGVDGADVAGVQPAVVVEQLGGRLGAVEVAAGVERAAGEDLAVLGDADLDARLGPADRAELEARRGRWR